MAGDGDVRAGCEDCAVGERYGCVLYDALEADCDFGLVRGRNEGEDLIWEIGELTETGGIETLGFLEETIHLFELADGSFAPAAVLVEGLSDFVVKGLHILGMRAEVEEEMRRGHGGGVDGCKTND